MYQRIITFVLRLLSLDLLGIRYIFTYGSGKSDGSFAGKSLKIIIKSSDKLVIYLIFHNRSSFFYV